MFKSKRLTFVVLVALMVGALAVTASAEEFPTKPITLLVGFNPGGGTDLPARALAASIGGLLNNQPLIIVNQPGAGGMLANKTVATSKPDGYTLLMGWGNTGFTLGRHIRELPIEPFEDFRPVASVVKYSSCAAVPYDSPFQSLKDVVDYAQANPGELIWTHTNRGGEHWVNGKDLIRVTGVDMIEVPSSGGVDTRNSVAGGHADVGFFACFLAPPLVQEQKIRVVGIALPERSSLMPNVPTFKEQGFDIIDAFAVKMIAAPAGVSDEKIDSLAASFLEAMEHPSFVRMIENMNFEVLKLGPEESLALARELDSKYQKFLEETGGLE